MGVDILSVMPHQFSDSVLLGGVADYTGGDVMREYSYSVEFTFNGGVRGEQVWYFNAKDMLDVMQKVGVFMNSAMFVSDTGEVASSVTRLRILELGKFVKETS